MISISEKTQECNSDIARGESVTDLIDIANGINNQSIKLEKAWATLKAVMGYFDGKIEPGSLKASMVAASADDIHWLLSVVNDYLFEVIPSLDELGDATAEQYKAIKGLCPEERIEK